MGTLTADIPAGGVARGGAAPADLAELIGAFNEVTARLTESHETLQAEVARLQGELREANEQVERSRRLAALGEMAAGIAHEVRNPLGSIALYARMLRSDLPEASEERELATRIGRSVRDLDAIVGDVLAFAREIRPRMAVADVEALLLRSVEACCGLAAELGVRVESRSPESGVAEFACDSAMVQQALVNVVRNGVQAAAEGGRSVVVSGHVRRGRGARGGRGGGEIALRVADTGPGVPPEAIERMFNPFFTTRATGSGLGLAIVHRIVDAHGGRVVVHGGGGCGGAVVELRFPGGSGKVAEWQSGNVGEAAS
jgi:two-component system sensor histidine kinase HydH